MSAIVRPSSVRFGIALVLALGCTSQMGTVAPTDTGSSTGLGSGANGPSASADPAEIFQGDSVTFQWAYDDPYGNPVVDVFRVTQDVQRPLPARHSVVAGVAPAQGTGKDIPVLPADWPAGDRFVVQYRVNWYYLGGHGVATLTVPSDPIPVIPRPTLQVQTSPAPAKGNVNIVVQYDTALDLLASATLAIGANAGFDVTPGQVVAVPVSTSAVKCTLTVAYRRGAKTSVDLILPPASATARAAEDSSR